MIYEIEIATVSYMYSLRSFKLIKFIICPNEIVTHVVWFKMKLVESPHCL